MDEASMGVKTRAIYETMKEDAGVEYVPGSLRELELIEDMFEPRTGEVYVFLIDPDWDEDGRDAGGDDQEEMFPVDGGGGRRFYIWPSERKAPRHGPDSTRYRSLRAWATQQRLLMMGGFVDGPTAGFLLRYYFREMLVEGRLVNRLYYNRRSKKVYVRLLKDSSTQ